MESLSKLSSKLFLFVLLKCVTFDMVLTEGPPKLKATTDYKKIHFAHLNQSITLKCPVESSDFTTFIDWTKGNKSLYVERGYEITYKGTLKIRSVTNQHAGTYTCEAINGYGVLRVNLTLIVDNPETGNHNNTIANLNSVNRVHAIPPTIRKPPTTAVVDEVGGQATFHCIASGQPLPHMFWLKDGHLIQESIVKGRGHSSLKLKNLQKSDAGVYKCIARNNVGEDEMDFSLYVTEASAPPRIIGLEPKSVTIREGATAAFVCEVNNKPGLQLHIKWLKRVYDKEMEIKINDINLFRSGTTYYRPLNFTDSAIISGGVVKSKLLIRNAGKDDSGTYVCLALNDKGFNFKNVTLHVISTATPLSSPYYFSASNTSLAVTVTVAFVVILAILVFIFHILCRNKIKEKKACEKGPGSSFETTNFTNNRHLNKGNFSELLDPQLTSKLLSLDSTYFCEMPKNSV